jgi:hypothetical protein
MIADVQSHGCHDPGMQRIENSIPKGAEPVAGGAGAVAGVFGSGVRELSVGQLRSDYDE